MFNKQRTLTTYSLGSSCIIKAIVQDLTQQPSILQDASEVLLTIEDLNGSTIVQDEPMVRESIGRYYYKLQLPYYFSRIAFQANAFQPTAFQVTSIALKLGPYFGHIIAVEASTDKTIPMEFFILKEFNPYG